LKNPSQKYWDELAEVYQEETVISCNDFHYGPLVAGDSHYKLLPELQNKTCLEIGCGAGQNSIYLAKQGANCTAIDISQVQINIGNDIAKQEEVQVSFVRADMQELEEVAPQKEYDLIHSAFGIPFVQNQQQLLYQCFNKLCHGGRLLFSTAHPLWNGEWLELDGDNGVFINDYFHPMADLRENGDDAQACCQPLPISKTISTLLQAGFIIKAFLEPQPLANLRSTKHKKPPYYSEMWMEKYEDMKCVPFTIIIAADKPS